MCARTEYDVNWYYCSSNQFNNQAFPHLEYENSHPLHSPYAVKHIAIFRDA